MNAGHTSIEHSETERSFLQMRVALFGKVMTVVSALGLAAQIATSTPRELLDIWFLLSLSSAAIFVVIWLSCRSGKLSARTVRLIEACGLTASILAISVMGRFLAAKLGYRTVVDRSGWTAVPWSHFVGMTRMMMEFTLLYGAALTTALRAAIVPSSPRYTAVLTASLGVPIALIMSWPALPFDPPTGLDGSFASIPIGYSFAIVVNSAIWWVITTVVCTAITHTIYGLRAEVREARRLGQYTLESKLGEGGMGIVYRASHAMMRRPTAVKLLPPDRAGEKNLARFEREVQQTARLTHPNTITIFDYGSTPDGVFYYVMELLEGATVQRVVEQTGPMPPARVIQVLRGVVAALEEAHGIGLMHRDLKPANIILCQQGGRPDVPKLLDFGLVKEISSEADTGLTRDQEVSGTPLYMSPEAVTSPRSMDHRGDIYAIGAIAYFMLTAKTVFEGANLVEVCSHHLHTAPVSPSRRSSSAVPPELEAVVLACLEKKPEERPASAAALLQQLEACDDANGWTVDDARAWWQEHGGQLLDQQETAAPSAGTRTIAIDLARGR